jgi:8-oxo-dGTP diphosphatase
MERLDDIPTRIAVRAILINSEGKVLLTKRAPGTFEEGKWCLVGGKPDEGENLETGVTRETLEEVGVNFTPTSYYGEIDNPDTSSGQRWITHYFTGEIDNLPTKLGEREISEVGFFSSSELQEIDVAFDHRAVLTEYFEGKDK